MSLFEDLSNSLIAGNAKKVQELTQQALSEGHSPKEILDEGLIAGMNVVGERFKNNEFYVPEVLIAARAMQAGMSILEPLLAAAGVKPVGTVVIGTVRGDLHDIGKNLVAMMLKGAGFKIVDLGVNVQPDKFITTVKESKADLLGMSALLTTTVVNMKEVIALARKEQLPVKIMVGGAPVTPEFAKEIGADGFARNAALAVDKAKELLAA
jgi:5-methyltetrahydrofolate--homocysteine methyltransferase